MEEAMVLPQPCPLDLTVAELTGLDLGEDFLETLANLSPVDLTPARAGEVFRSRLRANLRTYVARVGPRVVATASLLLEPKFIHGGGLVGHLEDVAVHRDYQHQGIGTALVRHATEEARRHGCYKAILNCSERLAPFYAHLGYQPHDLGLRTDW
jgi:glucosamine-phosphate N-acetyltransferase